MQPSIGAHGLVGSGDTRTRVVEDGETAFPSLPRSLFLTRRPSSFFSSVPAHNVTDAGPLTETAEWVPGSHHGLPGHFSRSIQSPPTRPSVTTKCHCRSRQRVTA